MSTFPRRYLQYEAVKDKLSSEQSSTHTKKITVYSIGGIMRQTIPNPDNKDACKGVRETYDSGFLTQFDDMWISEADFDNPEFWRP